MPNPYMLSKLSNASRMTAVFGRSGKPLLKSTRTGASLPNMARTADALDGVPTKLSVPGKFNFTPPAAASAKPAQMSTMEKIQQGADSLVPFASNIANSFRRPIQPPVPKSMNPVRLQRVNFAAQAAEANREVTGANQGLDYLPENQATAVRTANMTQGIRAKNMYASQEQIQNAQIGNQEAQLNAGIDNQNTAQYNQWQDQRADMAMAHQTQASGNLANAADKYIGMRNEDAKMDLEKTKYAILQNLYAPDGVLRRFTDDMEVNKKTGLPTYRFKGTGKYRAGGMMKVYAHGGDLIPNGGGKPVANTASVPYSQSLEADRARDAMVQSTQGAAQFNNILNIAPRAAQTAEAMRSGDYYAPVAPTHQYVSLRQKTLPPVANPVNAYAAVKYSKGGSLRKVY